MPRFSESLFESIRNFGRMSPTEGRRQALQQPTQYQQMGTTDPLARSLGKMFGGLGVDTSYLQTAPERIAAETKGLDMSKPMDAARAMLIRAQYIQDPQMQAAMIMKAQELMQAEQQKQANKQQRENYAKNLVGRAKSVGFDLSIEDVLSPDADIGKISEDVRKQEAARFQKTSPKQYRKALARQAGISIQNIPDNELYAMSDKEFENLLSSEDAELKAFEDRNGRPVFHRVNKSTGQVLNPNYGKPPLAGAETKWVDADNLGLAPRTPTTKSEVYNMNTEVNEKLVDLGLKSFEELQQTAKGAADTIKRTQQALPLIDEMYTGLGAGAKLNIDRLGELLATSLGMPYDSSTIENTQAYTINRLEEMGNFIQKLGSGTGLSDKDAQIAIQAVAGDTSLSPEVLKRVLNDFITTARFAQNQFEKAAGILSRDKNITQEGMLELIRLTTEVQGTSLTAEQRADAYLAR